MKLEYTQLSVVADGDRYNFGIPVTGTHEKCFGKNGIMGGRAATGKEVIVYACAALNPEGQGAWQNPEVVKFPVQNYIRFRNVLTYIPNERKYGDARGGLFVDSDLMGEGIEKKTNVTRSLRGWRETKEGLFVKDDRLFVPYRSLRGNEWDGENRVLIALSDSYSAKSLEEMADASGRFRKPFWKIDIEAITEPNRRVPVLYVFGDVRLDLHCNYEGLNANGCAVWVPGFK